MTRSAQDLQNVIAWIEAEFRTCRAAAQRVGPGALGGDMLRNAVFESYLIHARRLISFFVPEARGGISPRDFGVKWPPSKATVRRLKDRRQEIDRYLYLGPPTWDNARRRAGDVRAKSLFDDLVSLLGDWGQEQMRTDPAAAARICNLISELQGGQRGLRP